MKHRAIAILALCSLAPLARAHPRSDVETLTKLMRGLRYEEVIEHALRLLRETVPGEHAELGRVYELMGTAYFMLSDLPHARDSLVRLFALEPNAGPPREASPKYRTFFERAQVEASRLALDCAPLAEVAEGRPIAIVAHTATAADPERIRVIVHYRLEGAGAYHGGRLELVQGELRAHLPGVTLPDRTPHAFEYWLEAKSDDGTSLAAVGTEAAPLRATIAPAGGDPTVAAVEPALPAPLAPAAAASPTPPLARPEASEPPKAAPPSPWAPAKLEGPSEGRSLKWTWIAAGSSTGLLIAGIVLGAKASGDFDSFKASPSRSLGDQVNHEAMAANVLFATSGVCALTAALLYYLEGPARETAAPRTSVGPINGGVGVRVDRKF